MRAQRISKKQSKISYILPVVGLFVGLLLAFAFLSFNKGPTSAIVNPLIKATPTPSPTPGPKPVSILLLGYGGPDHDGGYLTDTLIETVIQPDQKRVLMITIPRDLAVSIPISPTDTWEDKINAAFAIGIDDKSYPNKPDQYKASTNPGALSKKLIGDITGYPIDYYVALSFDGFVKAIDALGGVDPTFAQSFDDYRYPIRGKEEDTCGRSSEEVATLSATYKGDDLESMFPCRYEHLHVSKGTQHLDGETALKVARSRHSTETRGDFSRSERQRAIIEAAKEKIFKIGFLPKAIPFFLSLGKDLKTDVNVNLLTSMLPFAQDVRSYKIVPIALSDENVLNQGYNSRGQYVLTTKTTPYDWKTVQTFIQNEASRSADIKEASSSGKL